MARAEGMRPFGLPLGISAALHVAVAAVLLVFRPEASPARPPVYRVDLVAAPPGERQMGIVAPPATQPTKEAPPPRRPERNEQAMPAPTPRPQQRRQTAPATPTPTPATKAETPPVEQQQRAGGGAEGGRGADVANVHTEGIEFPFRGYLENIVRQIRLRFRPDNPSSPLSAEVMFLIHRDGRVSGVRITRRSGVYSFDLEAQGAIEAAGQDGAFGPLPAEFSDDVLPVVFSFDPRIVR